MPRLLLIKYICHSVFGIYSIIIQYEKFMTPVPAYGEHDSTTYNLSAGRLTKHQALYVVLA